MPAYVNMTHLTFVCTKCSGIHRELHYKIKGISVSTFAQEDVDSLAEGGNEMFNSLYLARYNSSRDMPLPTSSTEISKLRDFIRVKYSDKKWFSDSGDSRRESGGGSGFDSNSSFSDSGISGSASMTDAGRGAALQKVVHI